MSLSPPPAGAAGGVCTVASYTVGINCRGYFGRLVMDTRTQPTNCISSPNILHDFFSSFVPFICGFVIVVIIIIMFIIIAIIIAIIQSLCVFFLRAVEFSFLQG